MDVFVWIIFRSSHKDILYLLYLIPGFSVYFCVEIP